MSITIQEAIEKINLSLYNSKLNHDRAAHRGYFEAAEEIKKYMEAEQMAIDALREKAEREDPKPLTIEELRQLKAGEVIWHKSLQGLSDHWIVLTSHDIKIFQSDLTAHRYGKTWIVYRHKPKEVTE